MRTTRRGLLSKAGLATVGTLLGATGTGSAATDETLEGRFRSHNDSPVPNARIAVSYYDRSEGEYHFDYVRTEDDGYFQTSVPAGQRVGMGFYKSSEDAFLAPRRDGVPHIFNLPRVEVPEGGRDLGDYRLPRAYTLDARAVFAERPGGVEDAIPRFGSLRGRSYYASGYSYLTTDESGYMKLNDADFTGVEVVGDARVWMFPPGYEPYEEQRTADYAPYQEESVRDVTVTEDTSIEIDLSRRNGEGNGDGKDTENGKSGGSGK